MKLMVLLDAPGRVLFSSAADGRTVVRCEAPAIANEMRRGQPRVRENLAFIPMEIPLPGEAAKSITIGMVREAGTWKLLSLGLVLLDVPAMAKQWEQVDLHTREANIIAALQTIAHALATYQSAYGKLPDSLSWLGPAPQHEISPEAADLLDADLASGSKDGYSFRYTVVAPKADLPHEDADKSATFTLAATPEKYGVAGRRSFFLDASGSLHGADKKGVVANGNDPRIDPS